MNIFRSLVTLILSLFGVNSTPPEPPTPPAPPMPVPPAPPAPPEEEEDPVENLKWQLFAHHNEERAKRGAPPLVRNDMLDAAAQKHNDWMAKNGRLTHNQPGRDVAKRVREEGYRWTWVGENIAMGYDTPEAAMRGWMNSSGHRANILNGRFKDVGFGVTQDDRGRWWWTADFGTE